MNDAATPQPAPVHNDGPRVVDLSVSRVVDRYGNTDFGRQIREDLLARAELGFTKYGTHLQANNGRDALMDMYQEALDAVNYAVQVEVEGEASGVATYSPAAYLVRSAISLVAAIRWTINERSRTA